MAENEILKRIRKEYGDELKYAHQFEGLIGDIERKTGERLSLNTIRRIFGMNNETVVPRKSTMDIIAQYVGYPDYELLLKDVGEDSDISVFTPIDAIDVVDLEKGAQLQISYDPNRVLVMSYLGNFKFIVNESQGSKLEKGDELEITQMAVGFDLLVANVIREGKSLGPYHAAKQYGLKAIEKIS